MYTYIHNTHIHSYIHSYYSIHTEQTLDAYVDFILTCMLFNDTYSFYTKV